MTVRDPANEFTFEANLVEDEWHMLSLHQPDRRGRRMATYLFSAVLKLGWRVVDNTPAERALLAAHWFAGGRVQ